MNKTKKNNKIKVKPTVIPLKGTFEKLPRFPRVKLPLKKSTTKEKNPLAQVHSINGKQYQLKQINKKFNEDTLVTTIRMPKSFVTKIDKFRKAIVPKMTRNDFILRAIKEAMQ